MIDYYIPGVMVEVEHSEQEGRQQQEEEHCVEGRRPDWHGGQEDLHGEGGHVEGEHHGVEDLQMLKKIY